MAPCNGTTSTPPKLAVTLPFPHQSTLQWHPAMAPRPLPQSWPSPSPSPAIAHDNGTLQWHHVHSPKIGRQAPYLQWHPIMALKALPHLPPPRHTTMAPNNGTTSTLLKLVRQHTTMAPCNGTLQWHHVHSPNLAVTLPSPTIAHYNGTLQWHHVHHDNGTLRWHPAMAPRPPRPLHPAMAPWCRVQSAKVVRRPHPLLEVRTL